MGSRVPRLCQCVHPLSHRCLAYVALPRTATVPFEQFHIRKQSPTCVFISNDYTESAPNQCRRHESRNKSQWPEFPYAQPQQ